MIQSAWWMSPLVAFLISVFTSMVGISGAVFLLPFQMSVLGLTGPVASATNLVFNLVAIPFGVYRYGRERRILWPLALVIIVGSVPGMFVGALIRTSWLADARRFQLFVGCVLLWLAVRLARDVVRSWRRPRPSGAPSDGALRVIAFSPRQLSFEFRGDVHRCRPLTISAVSMLVGVVGGIYGIGGGAIIAPFLVAMYGLPVYVIAGAALLGTFATSAVGAAFYQLLAIVHPIPGLAVAPDWWQGAQFGLGGAIGIYLGARAQRFVPAVYLKTALVLVLTGLGLRYLWAGRGAPVVLWIAMAAALLIVVALERLEVNLKPRRE